jgi:hypothetical protein
MPAGINHVYYIIGLQTKKGEDSGLQHIDFRLSSLSVSCTIKEGKSMERAGSKDSLTARMGSAKHSE